MSTNQDKRDLVFLSYAHYDLKKVSTVYVGLRRRRVNIWFDKVDLKAGKWKPQIMKTISRSRYFVICLSKAALERTSGSKPGFQDEELQYAYEIAISQQEDKFCIIPVRLEYCDRGDHRLSTFQQYDLFEDWESGLDRLAVNLGGVSLYDAIEKDERTEEDKMLAGIMSRGFVYYLTSEYEKALSMLEAAINIKFGYHEAWSNKGVSLNAMGRYGEAINAYNKAIEIKPDYYEVWYNRGVALRNLNHKDEAIKSFNKAIEINPNHYDSWYNKGIALSDLERHEEAIEAYDKAIEIKPDNNEAWYKKGVALNVLGRNKEAKEILKKCDIYINDNGTSTTYYTLEDLERKKNINKAWDALYNKGVILSILGRHEEALEILDKALEIMPNDGKAWYNRGNVLAALGRSVEADEAYNKATEIWKENYYKGNFLASSGRYEAALKAYDKAIEIKPDDSGVWYKKGLAFSNLGRYKEALEAYNKSIEIEPDYDNAWYFKGVTLDDLGRYEEAIKACNKAIEINPDNVGAWNTKGFVLNKLGRKDEAKKAFKRARVIQGLL